MNFIYFVLIVLTLYSSSNCVDPEDNDIPVIEGDGGKIITAIEDDVLILTQENFDLQITSKNIILVEFYAPWCGHCKTLAPEYAKAAKILKDEDPPIPLAKVDATIETDLASRYNVNEFPSLFIFKRGEKFPYDGPRSAMAIVEYMRLQADPDRKPPPEAVLTLTSENFTDTIDNAEIILVEFYAPWCGHCKNLAPEYERAAQILKHLSTPIPLAKVDGTVEKELSDKYEARGWPTLMIFRKGRKYSYNGPREESGIVSYMKDQVKSPSQETISANALKNAFSKFDITVVGFFKSQNEPVYQQYLESANLLRGKFSFHHTFDNKVSKEFGVSENTIVLYHPEIFASDYEPSKYEFSNVDGTSADITQFFKEHCLPLVGERTLKSRWKYQDSFPLVVVYYDVDFSFEHRVQTQLIRKEVAKLAKDYKGKVTFAISNEDEYVDELISLKLDDSGEDVNVGYYKTEKLRYRMEPVEDFSADDLREFVESVHTGKHELHIKSQPVPKENKGPVITVVGSTFEQLVSNNDKDVLIEFYAPWCGHCKKLEPIFKKLGKVFSDNKKIIICKFDATANDYPALFTPQGFPTIYYIPASSKDNLIQFDGERNLDELTKFVNKQLEKNDGVKDEL